MAIPPPDEAFPAPLAVDVPAVWLHIVGIIDSEPEVEVLATGDGAFYRFGLAPHSRAVRRFLRSIGVINAARLQEGAYESKAGFGPFRLEARAVGRDDADEDAVGAIVLENVKLTE